jgi:DNA-binding transcriptional LysR family regulator
MQIDLIKLTHILAIARTLSFSRAAEELHITQPALSRSISGVEQRFGIRLFDRGRSGVAVTPVGAQVIADAEGLVGSARIFQHNLRLYAQGQAGTLAIGMGPMVASMILSELAGHFMTGSPQLELRASIKGPGLLMKELANDTIELAICATENIDIADGFVAVPIGEVTFATYVRSAHPLANRSGLTAADLDVFPIARIGDADMVATRRNSGSFICDSYHILQDAVLHSDCLWHTSSQFVEKHQLTGSLVQIEAVDVETPRSALALVRKRGRTASPAAQLAASRIRAMLGTG